MTIQIKSTSQVEQTPQRPARGDKIRRWPQPVKTNPSEPTNGRVGNYCYDTKGTKDLIVIWRHDGNDKPPTCSTDPRCILSVSEWVDLKKENAILICTALDKSDAN